MNDDGSEAPMAIPPRIAQSLQPAPAEALDASRTRRAFLAHMRHHLRTPINAMIGYSEMLLEDVAERGQEDFIPDLQRIHTASNQLLAHVNDIFDPARLDTSQCSLELDTFGANLQPILLTPVTAIIGYSEMLLEDAADQGQEDIIPDLQKIHDAAQHFLVLINNTANSPALQAAAGDIDHQAPAASPISWEIETAIHSPARAVGDTVQTDHGSLLVVDDNEINRDVLSRRLVQRGYCVAVAADGRQALQMLMSQPFDLVLLDIMMPGMSGFELLTILRERHSAAELPVIMATASDQSSDIVAALTLGANDYVTKPLDFPVVLARIRTQLSLKRAIQEIHRLAEQLELRNRFIRTTFGRYLADEVVTSLLDSPEGLKLGGERREVTILMADLRGFTSLSGWLAPEQVVVILNRYLGTMVDIIMRHQGTIDAFIGDAIFVIFGAPLWMDDHPQRAVACAVAMQLAMSSVNAQNRSEGLPEVEMGIGLNTGEVVVGNIGSHKRAKYGLVGSHVNLTARIESYTVGGQILISEATRHAVGSDVIVDAQVAVEAKGIEQPITLYDVRGIGGEYNLFLPEREEMFFPLHNDIPLQFTVLEGKHIGRTVFTGTFVQLSVKGGEVRSEHPVSPLSDIKIRLLGPTGEELAGDLYGKVVGKPTDRRASFAVRFTSIPPEVATFLHSLSWRAASLDAEHHPGR
jgi:adenylate cyclase